MNTELFILKISFTIFLKILVSQLIFLIYASCNSHWNVRETVVYFDKMLNLCISCCFPLLSLMLTNIYLFLRYLIFVKWPLPCFLIITDTRLCMVQWADRYFRYLPFNFILSNITVNWTHWTGPLQVWYFHSVFKFLSYLTQKRCTTLNT